MKQYLKIFKCFAPELRIVLLHLKDSQHNEQDVDAIRTSTTATPLQKKITLKCVTGRGFNINLNRTLKFELI